MIREKLFNGLTNFFAKITVGYQSSIKYQLLLFLTMFSLVPLFVLGAVSYSASKRTIDNKVIDYSRQLVRQTAENIDLRLSVYKDAMIQIITNPEIIRILKETDAFPSQQRILDNLSLTTKLAYYLATSPEFKSASFISKNHYIKGIFWWADDIWAISSSFYQETIRGENNFLWFPTRKGYFADSADKHYENVFSLTKQVYDINDGSSLGVVAVIDIREEILADICSKSTRGLPLQSFVIDETGIIITHPQKEYLFKNINLFFGTETSRKILSPHLKESSYLAVFRDKQVLVNTVKLENNNWRIIHIINDSYLYQESNRVIQVILIIAAVCILLSVVAAYFISCNISAPLQEMVVTMKEVMTGNLAARVKIKRNRKNQNEFVFLQENFNYMIAKVEELIQKIYEEQNNKRIAEIKALQMQINPHFLYNTLDIIKWTALFQKANNVAEMTSLLSRLLHISLGKGEETILVSEEIEHVQCYLGIQRFRFHFNIKVTFNIADDVRSLKTPKLILQPIVENAILHGLAEKTEGGTITINCSKIENKLKFEVIDNGCGIDGDTMEILKKSRRKIGEAFSGIGIANIDERIKLVCGAEYGVKIYSQPHQGTRVEIWLPILT